MNIKASGKKRILAFTILILLTFGYFFIGNKQADSADSDAIAVRVFPNPDHVSALHWYKKQNFSGSPQSIQVDGYEAIRDGHSVYVNVANISGSTAGPLDKFYTNIYLITYNQDADNKTEDIFSNILKNLKFNSNISGSGFCVENSEKSCVYDNECSVGDNCNSLKARVIRDTKRLSDLAGMNIALDDYYLRQGTYPKLGAGSYLPGKSLSVWPSWNSTLSSEIRAAVPKDPINKIGPCGVAGYNEDTCWNDVLKKFVETLPDLPTNSLIYGYFSLNNGADYNLCGVFETPFDIQPPLGSFTGCSQVCLDFDGDGYGLVGSTLCPNTQADCNDTPITGSSIHPGAIEICGDGIDQDCNGSDLACATSCVDIDGDGFDNCDASNPSDTDGQSADCNDNGPNINPGKPEICDGIDNNCSGTVDAGCDSDNDNYCSCEKTFVDGAILQTCTGTDNTNAATRAGTCDCKDSNFTVNPGATESCDGIDNNCNGEVDENCDKDSDGYCDCSANIIVGSNLSLTCSYTNTSNPFWVANSCDCLDALAYGAWNPGLSTEADCADGLDNDCDGAIDGADSDCASIPVCGDSVCSGTETSASCLTDCPVASVCGDGTCNGTETNTSCSTDCPVIPVCGDTICDVSEHGTCLADCPATCGDSVCNGSETASTCPSDCLAVCGDSICSGAENNTSCPSDCSAACLDGDGDGFLDATCGGTDCDDTKWWVSPGASETCDGIDNNCNGEIDENCDIDGDGYCNSSMQIYNNTTMCTNTLFIADGMSGDDCQDSLPLVNPGASPETDCSDGIDNDCDGQADCLDTDCATSPSCNVGCTFPITLPCTF